MTAFLHLIHLDHRYDPLRAQSDPQSPAPWDAFFYVERSARGIPQFVCTDYPYRMSGENPTSAVLEKVRRENSNLMKSNLGTLCNIRELDYSIMHLRQELRRIHQIMLRNGLSLIKAELLEESPPKQFLGVPERLKPSEVQIPARRLTTVWLKKPGILSWREGAGWIRWRIPGKT